MLMFRPAVLVPSVESQVMFNNGSVGGTGLSDPALKPCHADREAPTFMLYFTAFFTNP